MDNKELKDTILLPKTKLPLKRKEEIEQEIILFWRERSIQKKIFDSDRYYKREKFVVHDGPPYANGSIHAGHALNRVLKDIIIRFHSLLGKQIIFKPGWDTHGLPIEFKVISSQQILKSSLLIRDACRKYASEQLEIQRQQFKKLGLFADYDEYYATNDKQYEAKQLRVLADLVEKGFVYQGNKPVYWSWSNQTALAENEVEYLEKEDYSLIFKIPLVNNFYGFEKVCLLAWTTQPWTIPANMLIAVLEQYEYALIKKDDEILICGINYYNQQIKQLNGNKIELLFFFKGKELISLRYWKIYGQKESISFIVNGSDLVSMNEGTGIVHIAPACGPEDFKLAQQNGVNPVCILDEKGRFEKIDSIPALNGVFYQEASNWVVNDLKERNLVEKCNMIKHSYPHDWRDKSPLVYRLTKQWFIELTSIKDLILKNIEEVEWYPSQSKDQMIAFINGRNDWCISRQRKWGVPIPSLKEENGEEILQANVIRGVASLVEKEGSDFYYKEECISEIRTKYSLNKNISFGSDTLDVWFDSGVSNLCVLENDNWPADLYLEGKDQFRGWFNSSLILATIIRGKAPFKRVVSHGFVVDGNGRKMSKSLGNVIDPLQVIEKFGVDTFRLWTAITDFSKEMKINNEILIVVNENYQKIRNSLRFIVANINSSPNNFKSKSNNKSWIEDIYIRNLVAEMIEDSKEDYINYRLASICQRVNNFCINNLSSFYFEIIKDPLYCEGINSERRIFIVETLHLLALGILEVIAPITPILAEEVNRELEKDRKNFSEESFHLRKDCFKNIYFEKKIINDFERYLLTIRKEVFQALEKARSEKIIELNSQAMVEVIINDNEQFYYLENLKISNALENLFLVSQINIKKNANVKFNIEIKKTSSKKCQRCWKFNIPEEDLISICYRCKEVIENLLN